MQEITLWDIKFFQEGALVLVNEQAVVVDRNSEVALLIVNGKPVLVRSKSEGSRHLQNFLESCQSPNGVNEKVLLLRDMLFESNLPWT